MLRLSRGRPVLRRLGYASVPAKGHIHTSTFNDFLSQGVQRMKPVRPWHVRGGAFTSACLAQNGTLVILVLLRIWPLHVIVPAPHIQPFIKTPVLKSKPDVCMEAIESYHAEWKHLCKENSHQTLHVTSSRDRRLHIVGIYAVGDLALCVVVCRTLQHQIRKH